MANLAIVVLILSERSFTINNEFVEYMKDNTPPVIELNGGDLKIAIGEKFDEVGYTIYDDRSFPVVKIESNVDIKREGEYQIKYSANDDSGNTSEAVRNVQVVHPAGWIYLTFDDGPSEYTGRLLDVLKKYGVKATFFVTGAGDDELIKREFKEGHAVGLHSQTHDYSYIYTSLQNYFADLNSIGERVERVTGQKSYLLRFPGGSSNLISAYYDQGSHIMSQLVNEVSERNYAYFDWNVDSNDAGGASSADEVVQNVISSIRPDSISIVLQHDTKRFSVEAVERIIQFGIENNYMFGKLEQDSFPAHHGVNN